ncbi:MAG TPA: class II glutamine amidotransferase [Candidatus Sumerlaeota bacterium]|nr:class II glutamine amidotransferase [Candidatus Sumerlaeota bacterium]HOR26691.1 class II glutamine amidotransferase [Candidatus Sumerlaeota bacterium]HPK03287.1 class II glutamine amidotransferase [Candidatus Sumerlaeota bacterium]
MCGIVGLFIKNKTMRDQLGALATPMFVCMGDRGPDSGGLAVFNEPTPESAQRWRINVFARNREYPWEPLIHGLRQTHPATDIVASSNHAILMTDQAPEIVARWLGEYDPMLIVLSTGRVMDLYKDTGHPRELAERYHFTDLRGTHCVGHTRMATESAVTPAHSHPFVAGNDFCLVHNGSLSNHNSLRRLLERRGIQFETDNDTEAVCRFLQWRMREGDTIEESLARGFEELDGFYTLLMGTPERLVLVRDAFACKPGIIADTPDYVAIGSEFRTLAHLPRIHEANLFEPVPEKIYSWTIA